jgi:hypothetical protein
MRLEHLDAHCQGRPLQLASIDGQSRDLDGEAASGIGAAGRVRELCVEMKCLVVEPGILLRQQRGAGAVHHLQACQICDLAGVDAAAF